MAGGESNVTVHIGDQGVLVVDTGTQAMAPKLLAQIQRLAQERGGTHKAIRMVVNTNGRADHIGGNEIVAHVRAGVGADIVPSGALPKALAQRSAPGFCLPPLSHPGQRVPPRRPTDEPCRLELLESGHHQLKAIISHAWSICAAPGAVRLIARPRGFVTPAWSPSAAATCPRISMRHACRSQAGRLSMSRCRSETSCERCFSRNNHNFD